MEAAKKSALFKFALVFAVFTAILTALLFGASWLFKFDLLAWFGSAEQFRDHLAAHPVAGPLLYIFIQFVQVVIFIIPGEPVQIAGGYLFGVWLGFLYAALGITAGSLSNFFLARALGRPFVQRFFKKEELDSMETFISSPGAAIGFFILFLVPGLPKDILCYAAGLSAMGFGRFFLISFVGRLPALLGSVLIGDAAAQSAWPLLVGISAVALALFILGVVFRDRVHAIAEGLQARLSGSKAGPRGAEAESGPEGSGDRQTKDI